jgi:hypothetical protein
MDTKTITTTRDPNLLRNRISQLDGEIGKLQAERALVDACFQRLLGKGYKPNTDFPIQPLVDEAREIPPLRRPMGAPTE